MTEEPFILDPKNRDVASGNAPYQTPSDLRLLSNALTLTGFGLVLLPLLVLLLFWIVSFSLGSSFGLPLMIWIVPVVFVGLGIILVIIGRAISQRERRLSSRGQLIYGTLTSISSNTDGDDFMVLVDYRFVTPQGREIDKGNRYSQHYKANHLAKQPLPPVGTRIAIWYVDDKTYKIL